MEHVIAARRPAGGRLTALMIGAGSRGSRAYAPYPALHPDELEFVGVAEPDGGRRERFIDEHPGAAGCAVKSWEDLLHRPRMADLAFICTQDRMHYEPAMAAIDRGYDLFIEKPISFSPDECRNLDDSARRRGISTAVGHVLRYSTFFVKIKSILESGAVGRVHAVQHNENVGHLHMAHSFVRGPWRDSERSSPMILAKSCHDMDIITWLLGERCRRLSSFGSLSHFRPENAPKGAPKNCLEGCPAEDTCPYFAPRSYMDSSSHWAVHAGIAHLNPEEKREFLRTSSYGACVFHSDNNVVDHQVVNMEFSDGAVAAFTMSAFTAETTRTIKIMGGLGVIHGSMESDSIAVETFEDGERREYDLSSPDSNHYGGHGDGDMNLMHDFIAHCRDKATVPQLTPIGESMMSHFMAFAAEESRLTHRVIDMEDYMKRGNYGSL